MTSIDNRVPFVPSESAADSTVADGHTNMHTKCLVHTWSPGVNTDAFPLYCLKVGSTTYIPIPVVICGRCHAMATWLVYTVYR